MRLDRTARIPLAVGLCFVAGCGMGPQAELRLNEREYFEAPGLNVLVFSNGYSGLFSDSKLSGVELIHHGVRTATNGDVRLSSTPEQWDPIPEFSERRIEGGRIVASLSYPQHEFAYRIGAEPRDGGVLVSVHLDAPLPPALAGLAGLNLEFLPSSYFGRTWLMDGHGGTFPRHPAGPMLESPAGKWEAVPLATGRTLVLAPEDPERRVTITASGDATLALFDGRNKAQNGWFVVRSLLPPDRTGTVVEWLITPHRVPGWTRPPVIAHSQAGYHTAEEKVAVLELDPAEGDARTVTLYRIQPDGRLVRVLRAPAEPWGGYLRYEYARFDFSAVREPGLYLLEAGKVRSEPFRIADDVYGAGLWSSTLDTFLPVQMDHVMVNDNYRVWHGASHLDDARQAPVDHEHFDLYAQGPTTDSPFRPGQHIPGLNTGGWYDAGDFDIRTQSQYATVSTLALARETFAIDWDETTVRQKDRFVDLRRPDGVPDILQQIEHGALALLAQFRAAGHAIPGIVEPTLDQYTHLGDAVTKTDNLVYDPALDSLESDGRRSGTPDDRWAFTSRSTALDYGSIAALAAASRVLRGYDDALAEESLRTAVRVWDEEHAREPAVFRFGNTTGGRLEDEELKAAVELLIATRGEAKYGDRLRAMMPFIEVEFAASGALAARALPFMDEPFRRRVEAAATAYRAAMDSALALNPFGVPISTGGWGGSGGVLAFAMRNHILHRALPEIIGPEYTVRALGYILGTHPANSVSLVSGTGAHSKTIAYGNNRADYSFIPGGVVPGIVIVQPDFPELKEDWPFLWFENEYVIPVAALFIYVANAVHQLLD